MINKLEQKFAELELRKATALMPFLTAGFPNFTTFGKLAEVISESGADVLEIGFPHSDPLADGPVIQHSSHQAIQNGFTMKKGFSAIEQISKKSNMALVVMCYANLILRYGIKKFIEDCSNSGVSGLIVPDMIIEESSEVRAISSENNISFINLITPTTETKRIEDITKLSAGFIYLVSVAGTTGMRSNLSYNYGSIIKTINKFKDIPVCLGFGISSPEMAAKAARQVDGVIIGSAIISLLNSNKGTTRILELRKFLTKCRKVLG